MTNANVQISSTPTPAQAAGLTQAACPACKASQWVRSSLLVRGKFPLFHCGACGLGALDAPEDNEEGFDEYWTDVNQRIYADKAVVDELANKYDGYFKQVAKEVPNKRYLDVGSGAGVSIATAANLGFEASGIEPSQHAVALSRSRYNLPVVQGLLGVNDTLPHDHGMLSLWDVIEHVSDPEILIRACNAHLATGGVLLLETPDEGTLLRRLICAVGRLGIPGLDLRQSIYYRAHRFYFTRQAMTALLERCGFTNVRYHGEHTMFQKELRKKALYEHAPAWKLLVLRIVFGALKALPLMANKMVVVATKAR